jgi:hypothetical protein
MRFIALSLLLASSILANAQAPAVPVLIDGATAKQHLLASPGPFIPPIALAAHMFGDVQLQLWIDPAGRVSAVTVLSGPAMLEGASIESAQEWLYQPFLKEGQPVPATTVITFKYKDGTPLPKTSDKPFPPAFFQAQAACVDALQAKPNPDKQAKACGQAASMAETLPTGFNTAVTQRTAYFRAADSLLLDKQYKQALVFADKAVALTESGNGDMDGACKAYAVRAEVESNLNDFAASDRAFTMSEGYENGAIQVIQNDKLKAQYTRLLKSILGLHANLLTAAGKPAEAQAKAQEAAKL